MSSRLRETAMFSTSQQETNTYSEDIRVEFKNAIKELAVSVFLSPEERGYCTDGPFSTRLYLSNPNVSVRDKIIF